MTSALLLLEGAWDSKALHSKAQKYVEEMFTCHRDDWKFCFWSSLAIELLARAALAKVSPTLLADLSDWNNVLSALGYQPTAAKFSPKSITTREVLRRLRQILPSFDTELENFCAVHSDRRNSELHSGHLAFEGVRDSSWLPGFYKCCDVLLRALDSNLEEFLGTQEAEVAQKLIASAADNAAKAIVSTVNSHEMVWLGKSDDERKQLCSQATIWATKHIGHRVECPACKSVAILLGEPISAPAKTLKNDMIIETQAYLPGKFECIACGMKIGKLSQLSAIGLGDSYKSTHTYDAAEYYAGTEDFHTEWEDDNNEPF